MIARFNPPAALANYQGVKRLLGLFQANRFRRGLRNVVKATPHEARTDSFASRSPPRKRIFPQERSASVLETPSCARVYLSRGSYRARAAGLGTPDNLSLSTLLSYAGSLALPIRVFYVYLSAGYGDNLTLNLLRSERAMCYDALMDTNRYVEAGRIGGRKAVEQNRDFQKMGSLGGRRTVEKYGVEHMSAIARVKKPRTPKEDAPDATTPPG